VLTPFDRDLNRIPHGSFVSAARCSMKAATASPLRHHQRGEFALLDERERLLDALLDSGLPPQKLIPGTGCCALPIPSASRAKQRARVAPAC